MPSNEFTTPSYLDSFFNETGYSYDHSSTDDSDVYQSNSNPWRQVVWTLLFAGMVVVATAGNLLVIWVVLANKRMRTVTNYFLVNISVAGAMMSVLHVLFNFTFYLNSDWPFGLFYCKFSQFISRLSIATSVFTLLAITVERYVAIMCPLWEELGKRATLGITAAIWGCSVFISCPTFIYSTTDLSPDGTNRQFCYEQWPDVDGLTTAIQSRMMYIYNVVLMVVTYILPILAMTYAYTRVGIQLWSSQSIAGCTQGQLDSVKRKRSVLKMMIVVVIVYVVCWLPYYVGFFVMHHHLEVFMYVHIQEIFMAIYWLAMSNSMFNPIIYFWMNSEFREGFKQLFSCCGTIWHNGVRMDDRPSGTKGMDRSGQALSSTGKDERYKLDANFCDNTHNNTTMVSTA